MVEYMAMLLADQSIGKSIGFFDALVQVVFG